MPIIDPRDTDLAQLLISHSIKAKKGELVFIEAVGLDTVGLAMALSKAVLNAGAAPYVHIVEPEQRRAFLLNAKEASMERLGEFELLQMQNADCFIGIRGTQNSFENADVSRDQMKLYAKHIAKPVHLEERVKRTRWCVLRYPNPAMAQLAQRSREAFAEFYYKVCTLDYAKMARDVRALKALMEKTDHVHIRGPGTDLQFSMKNIPVVPCTGTHNIPDGECFSAPVKDSVNGTVAFNAPTIWDGAPYEQLAMTFKDGRIIKATAANKDQTDRLNKILDQDEGARYVGEFSLAFNPMIKHPMRDILFDEKIAGSFHMAMGQAYEEANNSNQSALHWDMVCIQRKDYGGGEMYFDGKLVRKDGVFLAKNLAGLNP